jgi:uncharacterized small protein (DUF1192 family)
LKAIIREINDRYEEHVKIEERFQEELHDLRSEKQETEAVLTNSNQQLLQHITQLEEQISQLQGDLDRMEAEHNHQEEERLVYERAAEQVHASPSEETMQLLRQMDELNRSKEEVQQKIHQKDREITNLGSHI